MFLNFAFLPLPGTQHRAKCLPDAFLVATLQVATKLQPCDLHAVDISVHEKLSQFIDHPLIGIMITSIK